MDPEQHSKFGRRSNQHVHVMKASPWHIPRTANEEMLKQ